MRRHALTIATFAGATLVLAACSSGGPTVTTDDVDVPEDWSAEVVDDDQVGTFVVAAPGEAARWTPGDDLGALSDLTAGTAWGAFWLPQLENASGDSNIRTVVADTSTIEDEVVSWQVNVTPREDDGDFEDPETMAGNLADGLAFQGLEIADAGAATWAGQTVARVTFRVPEDVFGGEVRYVRQWFVPRTEPSALWSFSCDGPDDPEATNAVCATAVDGFRPAPDGG